MTSSPPPPSTLMPDLSTNPLHRSQPTGSACCAGNPRQGYANWPAINELCAVDPTLGLNENRKFALIDSDRDALAAPYQDLPGPRCPDGAGRLAASAETTHASTQRTSVSVCWTSTRSTNDHIQPFQFRPLDMRYAYVETKAKLWNESRPTLVAAAAADSGFLLARRRAPRALDGAALHFSDCLVDQKVLFTDAYAIPFWLSAGPGKDDSDTPSLFDARCRATGRHVEAKSLQQSFGLPAAAWHRRRKDKQGQRDAGLAARARNRSLAALRRAERRSRAFRLAPHPLARLRANATRVRGTGRAGRGLAQPPRACYRRRYSSP